MQPFAALQELLQRRNQRFVCTDTGWPEPGPDRHVAVIRHEVTPPLDDSTLAALEEQIGIPELLAFYQRWGSARLYCDTIHREPIGFASAFYIAPPGSWAELQDRFEGWLEILDPEERADLLPAWIDAYVVVGEVPNSGNYFLVPLEGADRGKVFDFEHDGFEFIERAPDFEQFVDGLCTVNEALLFEILGHTRYADGKSSIQWLVREYLYDAADA